MRMRLAHILALIIVCGSTGVTAQEQSTLSGAPKRPLITGIAHIAFQVSDLIKAREFYGELLGYDEPFQIRNQDNSLALTYFKVNERQYIEIFPGLPPDKDDRLMHIAFETTDLEALRVYLMSKGVKAPEKVNQGRDGNLNFTVSDPDGHRVEFVQYEPDSWTAQHHGKDMPPTRTSQHMIHTGFTVASASAAMKFYADLLGFREFWRGSSDDKELSWINMRVPDGDDYVEFMLYRDPPTAQRLG